MPKTLTICPYCGCGCNLYLQVEDERVVGVEPSPGHPVNRGMLCVKGWNAHGFVHASDRLTKPLVRRNGALQEASWEEAVGRVADGLLEIRSRHNADALAFLSSAKVTNEENFLFMKMARAVFGTNNVDHCARL